MENFHIVVDGRIPTTPSLVFLCMLVCDVSKSWLNVIFLVVQNYNRQSPKK